jgi:hypothetical protein
VRVVGVQRELSLVFIPSYLVALATPLYARSTNNEKLLVDATILLALVGWLFVLGSRAAMWPLAVLVTAAVLIFLGIHRRARPVPPTSPGAEPQRP